MLADWRLDPPADPSEEEMVTDHDLYMEAVMADEPCEHPDMDEYVIGDRTADWVCTGCGVFASDLARAS